MRAIYVQLSTEHRQALLRAADEDYRTPREEAAYLILEGLRRRKQVPEPVWLHEDPEYADPVTAAKAEADRA